jgi:hypothetical protein
MDLWDTSSLIPHMHGHARPTPSASEAPSAVSHTRSTAWEATRANAATSCVWAGCWPGISDQFPCHIAACSVGLAVTAAVKATSGQWDSVLEWGAGSKSTHGSRKSPGQLCNNTVTLD